ncbi:MAG: hypothetical protein IPK79_13365 [Vampirovibrionales bacterium]|jgi:hypothetical protein|nr:hypothetical protein [Vampirovibrionales bacterium]
MKSLYNIAGILPAQCRSNPNDCGISWLEHRSLPTAGNGKSAIQLQIELDREESCKALKKLAAYVRSSQTLKPIDPSTIKVGDTVRLVGGRSKQEFGYECLEIGKDYKVVGVDSGDVWMPVCIGCDTPSGKSWMYGEDLMLVDSV